MNGDIHPPSDRHDPIDRTASLARDRRADDRPLRRNISVRFESKPLWPPIDIGEVEHVDLARARCRRSCCRSGARKANRRRAPTAGCAEPAPRPRRPYREQVAIGGRDVEHAVGDRQRRQRLPVCPCCCAAATDLRRQRRAAAGTDPNDDAVLRSRVNRAGGVPRSAKRPRRARARVGPQRAAVRPEPARTALLVAPANKMSPLPRMVGQVTRRQPCVSPHFRAPPGRKAPTPPFPARVDDRAVGGHRHAARAPRSRGTSSACDRRCRTP